MQLDRPLDQIVREIHQMDRHRCIDELTHFRDLPLDFDAEFLDSYSVGWLRHTLLAAVVTVHERRHRQGRGGGAGGATRIPFSPHLAGCL